MRRAEAVVLLTAALVMVVGGLTWLFGPYGLLGTGLAIGVVALLIVDVKE